MRQEVGMMESREGPAIAVGAGDGRAIELELQPLFPKLKPGPGLPADLVLIDQRRRLHGAMVALVDRTGGDGVRVRPLIQAAGVSTATFYRHFGGADDCLASTYDVVTSTALRHATASQRRHSGWEESLRAAVGTLMRDIANEPRAARLALVGVFSGEAGSRKRITHAVGALERLLSASFLEAPRSVPAPRHLIAGMTAGLLRVARTTVLADRIDELPGLSDALCDWMASLPDRGLLSLLAPLRDAERRLPRREPLPFPDRPLSPLHAQVGDARDRLICATLKLAAPEGFGKLTVRRVRTEAGVSRRHFEACFESLDECFLEAVDRAVAEAGGRAREWSDGTGGWSHRTYRFILALCAQAARDRNLARLAFIGIFATGHTGLLRREAAVSRATAEFSATVPAANIPSGISVEASIAAVCHIIQSDIATGRARSLPAIAPLLSYVVLAPLLGADKATAAIRAEL
jgi:AcrR family transcriptional regulator